jgi:hypothetical protein
MSSLVCPWCLNQVNQYKACKGTKDGKPVFMHIACNNTIAEINALKQQVQFLFALIKPPEATSGLSQVVDGSERPVEAPAVGAVDPGTNPPATIPAAEPAAEAATP